MIIHQFLFIYFYTIGAYNPKFALFSYFNGQHFYNYLNLQDKL